MIPNQGSLFLRIVPSFILFKISYFYQTQLKYVRFQEPNIDCCSFEKQLSLNSGIVARIRLKK